jgi:hypothetical protein
MKLASSTPIVADDCEALHPTSELAHDNGSAAVSFHRALALKIAGAGRNEP